MERDYYKILCRLSDQEHYLIWYTDDQDGLIVNEHGRVIDFLNVESLNAYALKNEFPIHEGMTIFDLDGIVNWIEQPNETSIDCVGFLNAWNLFSDVAASTGEAGRAFSKIDDCIETYDKLFRGNNLPALAMSGGKYIPQWTMNDIQEMIKIFKAGLALFRSVVQPI